MLSQKKQPLLVLLMVLPCLLAAAVAHGALTRQINYQGVLRNDDGTIVEDGNYTLRFVMAKAASPQTPGVWTSTKSVTTVNGIFETRLGDYYPLTVDFSTDTWLEVYIYDGGDYQPLTDQRVLITPSPYSLYAEEVGESAAVTSLSSMTGTVNLIGGTNVTVTPVGNDLRIDAVSGAGGDDGDWTINGSHLTHDGAGTVAIGTASPLTALAGHALMQVEANLYPALALDARSPSFGRWLLLHNGTSQDLLFSRATGSGLGTVMMVLDDSGKLGIGHNPATTLDIDGGNYMLSTTDPGDFQIGNDGNAFQIGVDTDGTNSGRVKLRAVGSSPFMNFSVGASSVMTMHAGSMDFWSGTKKARFWGGDTNDRGGQLFMYGIGSSPNVEIDGYNGSGGDVVITTEGGVDAVSMGSTSSGGLIRCRDASGNITVSIDGQYSDGLGRVTTEVLEITGGSDLSEQFSVAAAATALELEPGMVVCIDPDNPGELRVSDSSYDRKVAGVISGAGGVRPGMLMGQKGSLADGDHPVALTGRVYVQADASNGAIEPGDLLTSSEGPGRAMKVTDHARANGAILGKAMTGLAEGEGLVLVLVSLQ